MSPVCSSLFIGGLGDKGRNPDFGFVCLILSGPSFRLPFPLLHEEWKVSKARGRGHKRKESYSVNAFSKGIHRENSPSVRGAS